MLASLTPKEDDKIEAPRVIVDKGKPVEEQDQEASETSRAASVLGKKGGAAAAAKREAAPKEKDAAEEIEQAGDLKARKQKASERVGEATRQASEARRDLEQERTYRKDLE